MMEFSSALPVWDKLSPEHRQRITASLIRKKVEKGAVLHDGSEECAGLMMVISGQLRAYMISPEGREMTLYRLFDMDLCLFSASCVMPSVQFDVMISAEKDTELLVLPPWVFKRIMEESAPFANYINELMATRFSEVIWLVEQVMWKSLDKRVANFLLEEAEIEGTPLLRMTHETIANHLGTHREVVTRMLRYFQSEGMVRLTRGAVELTNREKLQGITE